MRIDKFLNATNLVKRRSIAQDMIANGAVKMSAQAVKASRNVKVGDVIELAYLDGSRFFEVLQIPTTKNVPKNQSADFVRETRA